MPVTTTVKIIRAVRGRSSFLRLPPAAARVILSAAKNPFSRLLSTFLLSLPSLGTGLSPAPAEAASVYQFVDRSQALLFEGRGWGHGVGLCQWGARGRALAGQSAEQIVGAYYQGTNIQPAVAPDTTIRVLIHSGLQLQPGESPRITARGGAWQLIPSGGAPVAGTPDSWLELSAGAAGPTYTARGRDGAKLAEGPIRGPLVLRPTDGTSRFVVGYKPAGDVPGRPGTYYDTYRGDLILSPTGDGLETVNRLSLQDYLRGVVPAEMPGLWPAEALRAQTLAARSFAVWQARGRAGERYDVDDTTRYQVYRGANIERDNVNAIVDATAGQVLLSGGQVAQAYFFSTCAGWTENNEDVWGGPPVPYLRGLRDADPSGRPYDADSPLFTWNTGAITAWQLEEMLNADPDTAVGRLTGLDLSQRTPSGRLKQVRATGTAGTRTIDSDVLQARFNRLRPNGVAQLLSTNFDLKWTDAAAVAQTQGGTPIQSTPTPVGAQPTAQSAQRTPTPAGTTTPTRVPTPIATPTPTYRLELTDPAPERPAGPTNQYLAATGHNLGGAFLRFYQDHGGLDLFGYPRTEEMLEDGKTVQYFQRARFEFQIDKAGTPYEVQLGLLGDTLTTPRRPFPPAAAFPNSADHQFFPETGHGLHYAFLSYWRTRGGLDVFGYPISEELYGENGWPYAVQYFQRARFEYHPELPEPYQVSLGLLGDQLLTQRYWLK